MKNIFKILIIATTIGFIFPTQIFAVLNTGVATPTLTVTSELCNNNGICEPHVGEDSTFCFNDCGCNNNGICEDQRMETEANCPADCSTSSSVGGGFDPKVFSLYIENLKINNITFDSAKILWQTSQTAFCTFYIGRTSDYEKEIISETELKTEHFVQLNNLNPSTEYHFNIFCDNGQGLNAETKDKYFTTLFVIDNVNNFVAKPGISEITLTWENPVSDNFKSVTIVRNLEYFPSNISDGEIIYQGKAEYFVDIGLTQGKDYYYTIFAEGLNGSFSSGAIAYAKIQIPGQIEEPIDILEPEIIIPDSKILEFKDFDFYSDGQKLLLEDERKLELESEKILTISVDKEKVPENYKKIIAKLKTEKNNFYYLFNLNKLEIVYNTSFLVPKNSGNYLITILFINQENKIIAKTDGELSIWKDEQTFLAEKLNIYFWINNTTFILVLFFSVAIFLLLLLLFLFKRRKKKKEEDEFKNINQI